MDHVDRNPGQSIIKTRPDTTMYSNTSRKYFSEIFVKEQYFKLLGKVKAMDHLTPKIDQAQPGLPKTKWTKMDKIQPK